MKRITQICRSLFQGASDNTIVQIARNAVVECVRYLTNMLILWLLVDFVLGEKNLALSTAIASLLSGIVNYCLSAIWVFNKKEKTAEKTLVQFLYFTLVGAVGLIINVGITTFCTNVCNVHYLVSNTIAQFVVFFFNFFVRKIFVFKK